MGRFPRAQDLHFDIDHYLNRIIPPSPLHKLPTPVSRFLGYRKEQEQDVGNIVGAWWSFVGAFCGLAIVAAVFNNTSSIQLHHPPALIASFGASAVLEYNAIRSPLGQPRNALLGHTFSAIVGVGITKLFLYHQDFERIKWLAGAVSCGTASAIMLLTGTVHPPGGASAVLAATSPEITAMGWYFVGVVMWGTTLMLIVGLAINNIQRQFPVYWWTPMDLRRAKKGDVETRGDGRGGVEKRRTREEQMDENERRRGESISVTAYEVEVPDDLSLNQEEVRVLEKLRERLRGLRERELAKERRGEAEDDGDGDGDELEKVSTSGQSSTDMTVVPSRGDGSTPGIYS